jgi:hypothetical protein
MNKYLGLGALVMTIRRPDLWADVNSAQKEIEEWVEYLDGKDAGHFISTGGFTLTVDDTYGTLKLSQKIVNFSGDEDGFAWVDRDASLW